MEIGADEVNDVVRDSLSFYETQRAEWRWFRSAFKAEFWKSNQYQDQGLAGIGVDADDGLPFKVQADRLKPFINAQVANLFYRGPRTQVEPPEVFETTSGRPPDMTELPDTIAAYLDAFLKRSGIRKRSTNVYQLALMYGSAAFKLGVDPKRKGDMVSRVWVQGLPPWELIFDREAESEEQQSFIGHLRYERVDVARDLVGELGSIVPEALPDYLEHGTSTPPRGEKKLERYVRLLEFYDLLAGEQRFYVVTGDHKSPNCRQVGAVAAIPYEYPTGLPAVPLVPVVLANVPDFPMQGVSAAKTVYELNAEQNFLLTVLANKMRREAATAYMSREGDLDADQLALWASGRDGVHIQVKAEGSLDNKIKALDPPMSSPLLDKMMAWIASAWGDVAAADGMMQGQQGKYLSATEASLMAGFGEATTGDIQQRMADAVSETCRLFLALSAAEMKKPMTVRVGSERRQLTKADLELPWTVSIVDSASTPLKDMRKKEAFLQVNKVLMEAVAIASGTAVEGQKPPEQVQRLAQEVANYIVQLWALPEPMSWDSLSAKSPDQKLEEEAREIIQTKLAPELQAAGMGAPPMPQAPAMPPQGPPLQPDPNLPPGGV